MELFYSLTSPYSRKILLIMDDLKLAHNVTLSLMKPLLDTTSRLPKANPLDKIPTLILDDGTTLYDSPVIADYLYHLAGIKPMPFDQHITVQKMQALADGIMDAAVSTQMERSREPSQQSPFWLERWHNAILRAVQEFDHNMIDHAQSWHLGSMSMICALDYLCFRHPTINWMESCPKAADWYHALCKKDILKKTDPRNQ